MASRYEAYKVKRGVNLADPEFWNPRFQDIDKRLNLREQDVDRSSAIINNLEALALQRLNDTFTPLVKEAQDRLNNLGASFSAESLTSQVVATGIKVFHLTDESAETYVYTDYVQIRPSVDTSISMLGPVLSYDRPTATLTVDIVHVEGSGTYADWLIRVGTPVDFTHSDRTDNPHETTAAQVGAYTTAQTDALVNSIVSDAIAAIPGVDLSSRLAKAANLTDLPDIAAARMALGLKLLATQDTVGWGQLASNIISSAANFLARSPNKLLTAESAWDAAYPQVRPGVSGGVWLDCNASTNFYLQLAGSITLAIPLNCKNGQSGGILLYNQAGPGMTVSYAAGWYPVNGVWPILSTVHGAFNYLTYQNMHGILVLSGGKLTG